MLKTARAYARANILLQIFQVPTNRVQSKSNFSWNIEPNVNADNEK